MVKSKLPKRTPKHVKEVIQSGLIEVDNIYPDVSASPLGSPVFTRYGEVYELDVQGHSNPSIHLTKGLVRVKNSQGESALELIVEGDKKTLKQAAEEIGIKVKPKKNKKRLGVDLFLGDRPLERIDEHHYGIPIKGYTQA